MCLLGTHPSATTLVSNCGRLLSIRRCTVGGPAQQGQLPQPTEETEEAHPCLRPLGKQVANKGDLGGLRAPWLYLSASDTEKASPSAISLPAIQGCDDPQPGPPQSGEPALPGQGPTPEVRS